MNKYLMKVINKADKIQNKFIQKIDNISLNIEQCFSIAYEIIYDYYARLEEWTERANKIEEMKNLAINQELIKERDRLRKNFERIMTPGEAQQMMIKVDDDNIMKLNKYWAGFEKKLRDQFPILILIH